MGKITDEMTSAGSPQKLQAEIRHTEAEMTDTINEIEERLSPHHLKEEFFSKVRSSVSGTMNRVKQTARENPIPLTILGIGVAILGGTLIKTTATRRERKKAGMAEDVPQMTETSGGTFSEREMSQITSQRRQFTSQDYFMGAAIGFLAGAVLAFMPKGVVSEERPGYIGIGVTPGRPLEETKPIIK